MSNKTKTTNRKENCQPKLVPKLRLPEFRSKEGWRIRTLKELLFEAKKRNRELEFSHSDVLSVSGEYGCVNQIEFMGRSYAGVSVKDYHVVEHGDIVYTKSPLKRNPFGIIKANKGKRGIVSTLYAVYRPFPDCSTTYLDHFFSGDHNLNSYLQPIVKKGPKNDMKVNNADVLKGDICVPELKEQQKIAEFLDTVDELLASQSKKVAALKTHKKGLMQQLFPGEGKAKPHLRFPQFEKGGEWMESTVAENVLTITPPKKLQTSDYLTIGSFPIVDQSQDYICGWTNDSESLIDVGFPVIVFGDHTCALKYIDRPFAQGADGIKILRPRGQIDTAFLFYSMQANPVVQESYKRHFSMLREKKLLFPDPKSGEQQRIADCLASLDDFITMQTQKLEALKTHKKALMQQLFLSMAVVNG
ncbi:restriction endonuclease subunit S [Ectopseudomonas khazarica]|uniref:restriction endonuclease subunit S n=1 Tax=Ectopseudomonas khazarica TaxID=2502979 RepID=UPI001AEF5494|nr:restriction endonuclease subunit S [Pseudomonas khazarica]QTS84682.1 restriction endonuclease subunit S [Pseudomonas khazarica]